MSIRLRLLLEAPTAVHALEDRYFTGIFEEAIGITISVALEEGQIRPLVLFELSCANNKIGDGRLGEAVRASLFVLADEVAQRS